MRVETQIEPLGILSKEFKPLGSQFLAVYDEETESEGGIIYAVAENTWWATVVVSGPDCTVVCGDSVLMSKYRGENISMSDGKFTILDEKDALAVQEE